MQDATFESFQEDRGLTIDEYVKYDPEPDDDERMKMQGFHIISSEDS
jgi:hypothetical protein